MYGQWGVGLGLDEPIRVAARIGDFSLIRAGESRRAKISKIEIHGGVRVVTLVLQLLVEYRVVFAFNLTMDCKHEKRRTTLTLILGTRRRFFVICAHYVLLSGVTPLLLLT